MKIFAKFLLIGVTFSVLGGCSSCGGAEDAASNGNTGNVNIVIPAKSANTNVNIASNANANLVPYNGIKNVNSNPTLDNSKVTVIDTANIKPTRRSKPMPENSELTATMNRKGEVIESRVFKDNKYLAKIERITITPKNVKLKVYLRNGKTYELAEGKIKNFKIAAVATILAAVGFKPVIKRDPNAKTKEEILRQRMKNSNAN